MAEYSVPGTAVAQYEVNKIGQADPKQHLSDLEDAIADIGKHQEDRVENILEREVPIVEDDLRHQENVPVWVDTMAEASLSELEDAIGDVVDRQEEDIVEKNVR